MKLLALDTSTEACSAALLLDGEIRLRCVLTERSHAELILPMVDGLLTDAGISLASLDGLAFGRGPGAFTGLRIACGVVQGLALGAGLRVAPISSLAAVAEQVPFADGATVLVCNDARMGEVYWGTYRRSASGAIETIAAEAVSPPERIPGMAVATGHAAGNGLTRYPDLRRRLAESGWRIHDDLWPRADAVARLGAVEFAAGRSVTAQQALPHYVRDDVARPSGPPVTAVS